MKIKLTVICPYCEHENVVDHEFDGLISLVKTIYCKSEEEGGCDMPIAYQVEFKPLVNVYKI